MDSPTSRKTASPPASAISVSSCRETRTHATFSRSSTPRSIPHISASDGRPYPHRLGAMESSSKFPLKNSSSVNSGSRPLLSCRICLNRSNPIITAAPRQTALMRCNSHITQPMRQAVIRGNPNQSKSCRLSIRSPNQDSRLIPIQNQFIQRGFRIFQWSIQFQIFQIFTGLLIVAGWTRTGVPAK